MSSSPVWHYWRILVVGTPPLQQGWETQPGKELKAMGRSSKLESHSTNILVVDDDRATRDLLHEVLTDEGYGVKTSGSAEEALEIGKGEFFDVIISDMKLGPDL